MRAHDGALAGRRTRSRRRLASPPRAFAERRAACPATRCIAGERRFDLEDSRRGELRQPPCRGAGARWRNAPCQHMSAAPARAWYARTSRFQVTSAATAAERIVRASGARFARVDRHRHSAGAIRGFDTAYQGRPKAGSRGFRRAWVRRSPSCRSIMWRGASSRCSKGSTGRRAAPTTWSPRRRCRSRR